MNQTTSIKLPIKWVNLLFVTLIPIFGVILSFLHLYYEGFNGSIWGIAVLFYFLTGVSITAGYHRLISHRAFDSNKFVKFVFLIFGAAAFQNSALKWCTDHRRHHAKVDTNEDPYNIKKGFFYAHMGWIFFEEEEIYKDKYPVDLKNDPLIIWQHKYYLLIAVFIGIIVPLIIGYFFHAPIGGIGVIGFLRIAFTQNCTFFVNSLCHMVGKQSYTEKNTARDSFIMAFFTYGEGYHNFHHCFQNDYRNGFKWYAWDPTKWLIKLLSLTNLTWNLRRTPDIEILKAKLSMDEKRIKNFFMRHPFYQNLADRFFETKSKLESTFEQLNYLKKEYKRLKREFKQNKMNEIQQAMIEVNRKIDVIKFEFNFHYNQWRYYKKSFAV